jgi:hypothetical protein
MIVAERLRAAATLSTQADEMPKSPWGRVVALIWMFTSVVFVAYFTAAVTIVKQGKFVLL